MDEKCNHKFTVWYGSHTKWPLLWLQQSVDIIANNSSSRMEFQLYCVGYKLVQVAYLMIKGFVTLCVVKGFIILMCTKLHVYV